MKTEEIKQYEAKVVTLGRDVIVKGANRRGILVSVDGSRCAVRFSDGSSSTVSILQLVPV